MSDKFIRFTGRITGITKSIRKLISEEVARLGLRRAYAIPIYFIYENGPISASKLSRLCGEDKANLSRTLHLLEADGYVVMEERTSPRRRVRVALTAEGERIGGLLSARSRELVAVASEGISAEAMAVMNDALFKIDENLRAALEGALD